MNTNARDRIAEMVGWSKNPLGGWNSPTHSGEDRLEHPIPASLDFVSAAWPENHPFVDLTGYDHDDRLNEAFYWYAAKLEYLRDHNKPALADVLAKLSRSDRIAVYNALQKEHYFGPEGVNAGPVSFMYFTLTCNPAIIADAVYEVVSSKSNP